MGHLTLQLEYQDDSKIPEMFNRAPLCGGELTAFSFGREISNLRRLEAIIIELNHFKMFKDREEEVIDISSFLDDDDEIDLENLLYNLERLL